MLGLPELQKPIELRKNGGAWFLLPDGRQIHIGVTPDFAPRKKGHPGFLTGDLNAVQEVLNVNHIPFKPDTEAGVPRVFLHDPWGNRLEIVQGAHESRPVALAGSSNASKSECLNARK